VELKLVAVGLGQLPERILVAGASGQLGTDLLRAFADLQPVGLDHRALEIEAASPFGNAAAVFTERGIYRPGEPLYAKADLTLDTSERAPEQSLDDLMDLLGYAERSGMRHYA